MKKDCQKPDFSCKAQSSSKTVTERNLGHCASNSNYHQVLKTKSKIKHVILTL